MHCWWTFITRARLSRYLNYYKYNNVRNEPSPRERKEDETPCTRVRFFPKNFIKRDISRIKISIRKNRKSNFVVAISHNPREKNPHYTSRQTDRCRVNKEKSSITKQNIHLSNVRIHLRKIRDSFNINAIRWTSERIILQFGSCREMLCKMFCLEETRGGKAPLYPIEGSPLLYLW